MPTIVKGSGASSRFSSQVAKKLNPDLNLPTGSYVISTTRNSLRDIPLLASVTARVSLNGVELVGGWCYKTNGAGTPSYSMDSWYGQGLFIPRCYDCDLTATLNAVDTILNTSGLTVTHWLRRL